MSIKFDFEKSKFCGVNGELNFPEDDKLIKKLAMLIEGECDGLGVSKTAKKFGYSRQRYHQLRNQCTTLGSASLVELSRGPKTNYRRTEEVVKRIIRHRFLDPDASPEVITQKLHQEQVEISIRSVERVITEYGLQKKGSTH